jgi:hypothetical protein
MTRAWHRWPVLLAACLASTAVTGCAAAMSDSHPSGGAPPTRAPSSAHAAPLSSSPPGVNAAAFDALAAQEASAWASSPLAVQWRSGLVVFTAGELTSGPSSGFPSDADKLAFINGNLVFTGPPPSGAPAGLVTWPDGTTMKVPVLSAARALGELTSSKQCPGCATTSLDVTAIRPATLAVETSRGRATVPAWAFTLEGVAAPVIEAALPPGSYVLPGSQGAPPGKELAALGTGFVGAMDATVSADGRTLALRLDGSPCDKTWGGLVDETASAVVIGGWMHDPDPDAPCAAMLVFRTTTVALSAPLAGRVIIDAVTGQPVTQD